jgi:cytochrome b
LAAEAPPNGRVRVWDLPTRLSHWATVSLFGVCWWTADSDRMEWHRIAGYGVLGAVLFRLAWGFCGGQTARFGDFVRGPAATFRYARKLFRRRGDDGPAPLGHNPLGALSIILMLVLLLTQAALGLFAVNVDGFGSGPFAKWVSFETGRRIAHLHAANFQLLLLLVGLHLTAIGFYRLARREKLLAAMIHGSKPRATAGEVPYFVPAWRAVLLAAGIFILVALLLNIR